MDQGETPDGLCSVESQAETAQKVLDGFEIYFQNIPSYEALLQKQTVKA